MGIGSDPVVDVSLLCFNPKGVKSNVVRLRGSFGLTLIGFRPEFKPKGYDFSPITV